MKILKNLYIKRYRDYSLRESTPDLLRTIYVEREGKLSDLLQKFNKDIIRAQINVHHIVQRDIDTWETTSKGIDMINTMYKKHSPYQIIKNMIFGAY